MKKAPFLKAEDVGTYISKSYGSELKKTYQEEFPATTEAVVFKKSLLLKVLAMSKKLTGIRFMYGLADELNPNSIKVFLIPCTSTSSSDTATQALISENGYYAQDEQLYSIKDISEMMSLYVTSVLKRGLDLPYKKVTRGNYIGKNALNDLMKDSNCHFIQYYFGLRNLIIAPVLEPLDAQFNAFLDVYMDFINPCPPACREGGADCFATEAVTSFSLNQELDLYRQFRDTELLQMPDGGMLYEMYYFISPYITSIIHQSADKTKTLSDLYFNKILPFKELVTNNKNEAAAQFLKETLDDLARAYNQEFSMKI